MEKSIYYSGPLLVGLRFIFLVVTCRLVVVPERRLWCSGATVTEDFGSRFTISALSRYRRIVRFNTPPVIFLCAFLMESFRLFILRCSILLANCLL